MTVPRTGAAWQGALLPSARRIRRSRAVSIVAVAQVPVRYWSVEQDSARRLAFEPRPGDIVTRTRSKHGTTWMQMICALLIFQSAELRAPLADLSPWPDWLVLPPDEVLRGLRGYGIGDSSRRIRHLTGCHWTGGCGTSWPHDTRSMLG
jgi:hypothetical protein